MTPTIRPILSRSYSSVSVVGKTTRAELAVIRGRLALVMAVFKAPLLIAALRLAEMVAMEGSAPAVASIVWLESSTVLGEIAVVTIDDPLSTPTILTLE